jgi:hypothetical protein
MASRARKLHRVKHHGWLPIVPPVLAAALLALPADAKPSPSLPPPPRAPAPTVRLAPELLEAGDPLWRDLERLELSGVIPLGSTSVRPLPRGTIAGWLSSGTGPDARGDRQAWARLRRAFGRELRRLGDEDAPAETPAWIHLRGEPSADSVSLDGNRSELRIGPTLGVQARAGSGESELGDSTRVGLYGVYLIGRGVALQGELYAGEVEEGRGIGDPLIHGTDLLYFLDEASATVATPEIRARIARGRHRWGAGRGPSLLLDERAAPFSFVEYDLRLPAGMAFRSWTGSLNVFEERGIAAHRLAVPLHRDLHVAIAEGVRYKGGLDHPLYLMGLLPYTLVQRFDEQDISDRAQRLRQRNNVLAQAEILWRPRARSLVQLEVLVDDLPAENADAPARGGARLGVALLPTMGGEPLEVRLEGTKVGRTTYAVDYDGSCDCDWIHQDRALGDPAGPDQEAIRLWVGRSLARDHHLELRGRIANHGGGSLGEVWPDTLDIPEPTRRAFTLSDPVRRARVLEVAWRWEPRDNLWMETTGTISWRRDPALDPGEGYDSEWSLGAWARWRR